MATTMKWAPGLACAGALLLGAGAAAADDFAAGSLIIPMDTTYQDSGMLKAYGLIYDLLRHGVPVRWVIKQGKAFQGADFTASALDHQTSAVIAAHPYRGGPWVIDSADAAAALPIIDAWQVANPAVKVHQATAGFTGDVARLLVVAPRVAMHADGNQGIARGYLQAAGIPDSNLDPTWPNTSPDMLDPVEVAGPTTSNHHDGKLFDADGDPVYCQFMSMHWAVSSALANPEVVAEVRQFLSKPTHFFAECQAVNAFENLVPYGFFLTTQGFSIKSQPNQIDNYNFDSPFAQYDGAFGTVGGSEPAYALPAGGQYKAGNVTMITAKTFAPGTYDLWMTGYLDGNCPPYQELCGTLGKVSYLGGHQYSTSLPISTHPTTQGTRLFLNSLFDSTCAGASGQPIITVIKDAPQTTTDPDVTFTISYSNAGLTLALGAVLSDALPPGATFVSATNGGTFAAGKVTWSLGNLGQGEAGSVSFVAHLGAIGTYQNTAMIGYKVGLNSFTTASNTTTTLYDQDTDGDGIVDSVDTCPDDYNPLQDLSSDVLSCGACGVTCQIAFGLAGCQAGSCVVAACFAGRSNCNGLYADGCEYANAGFATDLANCGGCGIACSPANATGACAGGACTIGSCSPGQSDCNGNAADGCEYTSSGFASDPNNCGGCGVTCGAGLACLNGLCALSNCPPGTSDCNGNAADGCEYTSSGFASDPGNCGGCGITCAPAHGTGVCSGGACAVGACDPGFSDCDGLAGDGCEYANAGFAGDASNCGGCGIACIPPNGVGACAGGICAIAGCAPGFSDCNGDPADGCEVAGASFDSDPANCGGCGVTCAAPNAQGVCSGGACSEGPCDPGFLDLDGNPSNGCEYACSPVAPTDGTCDKKDDDCDGQIDEDYAPSTCGVGACQAQSACELGAELCTPLSPSIEGPEGDPTCDDGTDDDCDGDTDAADSNCQEAGCVTDADCDDGNPCTADACVAPFCSHEGVPDCGNGGSGGSTGTGATGGTGGSTSTGATGAGGSTSTGATGGSGTTGGSGGEDPGDTGGCACRLGGASPEHGSRTGVTAGVALLLALAAGRRRRRRGAGRC